jgi:predicted nucleic acid-binding protein
MATKAMMWRALYVEAAAVAKARGRARFDVGAVFIALSARSIGATVITRNATDFSAMREVRSFVPMVVPA